jgi:hypothetical protein
MCVNNYNEPMIMDSDTESVSDAESDTDSLFEEIFEKDEEYMDSDKVDQQLYIGFCEPIKKPNILLMEVVVSPTTFLEYSGNIIYNYLRQYVDPIKRFNGNLEIMKLDIIPTSGYYSVILKTHWLRLVQRNWKRIFRMRQKMITVRSYPPVQRVFELTGKYPGGLNVLPNLQGMLYRL